MNPRTPSGSSRSPIDCSTAVRRLWDYLDGRLPAMSRGEVEAHLAICAGCPPHFEFARTMKRALADAAPPDMLPEDEARLRARVRDVLRRFDGEGGRTTRS